MLVGLLNIIFNVLIFLVRVASWLVLIYVIMTLLMPQNKYTQLAAKYAEPILTPIRAWLSKTFPKLANIHLDVSPLVLWVLVEIVIWVLGILKRILL